MYINIRRSIFCHLLTNFDFIKIIITLTFRKCAKDRFMGGKNVIVSYSHSFSKDCGLDKSDPRIMFEPGDQGSLKGHTYEMYVGKQICVY